MLGELVECDAVSQPTYDWGSGRRDRRSAMAARITGRGIALIPASSREPSADRSSRATASRGWSSMTIPFDRGHRRCSSSSRVRDGLSPQTRRASTSRCRASSVRSRRRRQDIAALARDGRRARPWSASTRSRSACSRRRRATAPTSSAGTSNRSASTCTTAAAWRGFVASQRQRGVRLGIPDVPDRPRADRGGGRVRLRRGRVGSDLLHPARRFQGVHRHHPESLGDRGRRLPGAARAARARRARAGDHATRPLRGRAAGRAAGRAGSARSAPVLQGVRRRLLRTRRTVAEVNARCASAASSGGRTCQRSIPQLGQSALYCVTEVHTKADIDRLGDALAEVLAMTLRPFHQASWNEPILLELSSPGRAGHHPAGGRAGARSAAAAIRSPGSPPRAAPLRRRQLPEVSQQRVLRHYLRLSQETLGNDVNIHLGLGTCTMKYSPQGQRGAGPLAQGRRPAPAAGRGHGAGHARGHAPLRADAVRDLGPAPLHLPAGRRVAGRVRERADHPRLPRRAAATPSATRSSRRSSRTRATARARQRPATR